VVSDKAKSDIYRDLLPVLNSGRVELLDLPRLAGQLCGLERRTARSGKDAIDHAPGAHDDIANAVAGAVVSVIQRNQDALSHQPPMIIYGGQPGGMWANAGGNPWDEYRAAMWPQDRQARHG
jgi:hypothetical protein